MILVYVHIFFPLNIWVFIELEETIYHGTKLVILVDTILCNQVSVTHHTGKVNFLFHWYTFTYGNTCGLAFKKIANTLKLHKTAIQIFQKLLKSLNCI